ncbi:MAG: SIMPL domain-containing protein [Armatimonadia bacterium]
MGEDTQQGSRLSVEGTAHLVAEPDTATLRLRVTAEERQAAAAREKCASELAQMLQAVRNLGLPELRIETEHVSLTPVGKDGEVAYFDDLGMAPRKITGYRATQRLILTLTATEEAGSLAEGVSRIIDAAGNWREVALEGPQWSLSDAQELETEALRVATRNAVAKAEAIAEAAGVEIVELTFLGSSEGDGRPAYPMSYAPATYASTGPIPVPTEIEVERLNIRACLQLTALIRRKQAATGPIA